MDSEILLLLKQGLFESAEILCGCFGTVAPQSWPTTRLLMFADSLKEQGKFCRALEYYKIALRETKGRYVKTNLSPTINQEILILTNIAECFCELKQENKAIEYAAKIPLKSRPVKVHLVMGRCYEKLLKKKSASECYQQVLALQPFAVEAVLALLRLGVDARRLSGRYANEPRAKWLAKLIDAHGQRTSFKHKQSIKAYRDLCEDYPFTADFFAQKGLVELQAYDGDIARRSLEKAKNLDVHCTQGTDMLALILRKRGCAQELNELVYQLIRKNPDAPETWVAVALYNDHTGQKEKALEYVERALSLDDNHIGAHIVKSRVLFSIAETDSAVLSYRKAYQIRKGDMAVFEGLVEAYLAASEFKQALLTAKEALQLMPRNSKALTLVGLVLSHSPEGQEKAAKAFSKALVIDPSCVDAVMAAAKMHCHNKKYDEALKLIKGYMQEQSNDAHLSGDYMHTKLAHVYSLSGDLEQALTHFHKALSITPNYAQALSGIERLEQNLRGNDDSMVDDDNKEDSFEDYM